MTLIAVSIAVESADAVEGALGAARRAVADGAHMVEWRIDRLAGAPGGAGAALALLSASPAPSIATCRGAAEGGGFEGPEDDRAALLEALVLGDRPPRYVDVELSAWESAPALRRRLGEAMERRRGPGEHASLVLSVHDFERRPPDLLQKLKRMIDAPACDVVKVSWRARSVRDNLEALELLSERRKPMIALCMGRFGLLSRVLAPKFGGFLVYAAAGQEAPTAPGQPSVRELARYGFGRIGPATAVYGVVGWPVEHSLSPLIHNAGFEAVGHDGVYVPLPVPPEYEHFKATVGSLLDQEGLDFRGAGVTIPHKESLLRFVQERGGAADESAAQAGAANTLIAGAGGLRCTNTDSPALLSALRDTAGLAAAGLAGLRVAVLGAGGVARAAVSALSGAGARLVVFNRTHRRALALAAAFHGRPTASGQPAQVVAGKPQSIGCGCFEVYVNCTPVGMEGGPAPGEPALPPDVPLDERTVVLDTVYTPVRTPLVLRAEAAGARVVTGMDLFLRQAALQFEAWTGRPAPLEAFTGALQGPLR